MNCCNANAEHRAYICSGIKDNSGIIAQLTGALIVAVIFIVVIKSHLNPHLDVQLHSNVSVYCASIKWRLNTPGEDELSLVLK